MKGILYAVFLFLSLPNLIVGIALLLLRHTFATRQPLEIISSFLFGVGWGLPLAATFLVVLLVFGIFSATRPYAALFAIVLNIGALALVLSRFGLPAHLDQEIVFLPVILAFIGFTWLAYPVSQSRIKTNTANRPNIS